MTPSLEQLDQILTLFRKVTSPTQYLFPDQDLLNEVFAGRWKSIGYGYNALKTLSVAHPPIWNEELDPQSSTAGFLLETTQEIKQDAYYASFGISAVGQKEPSVMPVINIHYILEKPWKVTDLDKARDEKNQFVDLYRWWWQAHADMAREDPSFLS